MRLLEHEGKTLFNEYGITVPESVLVTTKDEIPSGAWVVKAQIHSGDRAKVGGIQFKTAEEHWDATNTSLGRVLNGETVESVLFEKIVEKDEERFFSFLYDASVGGPVLLLGTKGGSGVHQAVTFPIDLTAPLPDSFFMNALKDAGFPENEISIVTDVLTRAWKLFTDKKALVVEINPLFVTKDGRAVAGDAKVELDDAVEHPSERTYVELEGDIALLASGGGASMLALDALIKKGGRPANYTEYSGNPPKEVVTELTKRVLARADLAGCFVVGAAANFTDIEATLSGFLEGLRTITPKPTYPIVIRRDGPKRAEAFEMLREAAKKEGYDFHLYDATTPITDSARVMVDLAYPTRP